MMAYAEANPVMKIDETGQVAWVPVLVIGKCARIAVKYIMVRRKLAKQCDMIYATYYAACQLPSKCTKNDKCPELRVKEANARACVEIRSFFLQVGCCGLRAYGTGEPGRLKHSHRRNPDERQCIEKHEKQIAERNASLQNCRDLLGNELCCDDCQ